MERLHSTDSLEKIRHNPIQKGQAQNVHYKIVDSPVGPLTLIANHTSLLSLSWGGDLTTLPNDVLESAASHAILELTTQQLQEYFSGHRTSFSIPLEPIGTVFQKRAWQQLLKIPYGQYITYGEQARRLGQPTASRAVGGANGKNPIGIIIPCHRVIGASGALTGFTGGLDIKQKLLLIEGI